MKTIVIVSGGFDPVHIGHVRMFNEAKALGDTLLVIINNDNWLRKKKGYAFMLEQDRQEIISNFDSVDVCVVTDHPENPEDMSVCKDIKEAVEFFNSASSYTEETYKFIFANGGDRKADNIPEYKLCEELGIEMVFDVGGAKIRSSSELVKNEKDSRSRK